MPTVQDQIAQARAAGYSDDEIATKLASTNGYGEKIKTATAAGYKSSEIVSHLSGAATNGENDSEGVAQGKRMLADIDQVNRESGKLFIGAGETAANLATGIGSSVVGGFRGLYNGASTLAQGGSMDEAATAGAKAAQDTQHKYTYQPRTGVGKLGSEILSLPLNIAKSAATEIGGDVGQAIGGDQGRLVGESVGNVAPDIAATLAGGRAALRATPSIESAVAAKTSALRERIQSSAAKLNAMDEATLAGEPMPINQAFTSGPQSAGAAATDHTSMAAAAGATPEMQAIIKNAGGNVNPLAAERHAEASSLPVPIELTAGEATGNAGLISKEKNNRGKFQPASDFFDRRDEKFIENFDEVRNAVAPDVAARGTDLGQMAIDAIKESDAAERADISAKYKALEDANGGDFPLNARDFVVSADEALKKANRARFLPSEVQGILEDLRQGSQMTFGDFENYRTILAEQSRKADRAGDGTASYAISLVRNALENLPMIEESAALKPLADAARNAARVRFNRLDKDPAYKAAVDDGTALGEPSPLADDFIRKYVVQGRVANVQNLISNLSSNPLNQQILSAGVIDHIKHVSGVDLRTNTGNVSQAGLNNAITALGKKSRLLLGDEAASVVDKLGNVARYTMKQSKGQYVNNSNTNVSQLASGAKDAAMTVVDHKTLGATKFLRGVLDNRRFEKEMSRSFEPGAGIDTTIFPHSTSVQAAPTGAAAVPQSALRSYMDAQRHQRAIENLANAQTVDEAIKAVSEP